MPEPKTCPECSAEADKQGRRFDGPQGAMFLGLHRRREHGVEGTSATAGKRKRRQDRGPRQPRKPKTPPLSADLRRVFQVVGTVLAVADPYCGSILVDRSTAFCDALARLAETDERIGRWLRALARSGPYGALLVAAGQMAIPIAAHHELVPPEVTMLVGAPMPPSRARVPPVPAEESEPEPEPELEPVEGYPTRA